MGDSFVGKRVNSQNVGKVCSNFGHNKSPIYESLNKGKLLTAGEGAV